MASIRTIPSAAAIHFVAEVHSSSASPDASAGDFLLSGVSLEHSVYKGEQAFKRYCHIV